MLKTGEMKGSCEKEPGECDTRGTHLIRSLSYRQAKILFQEPGLLEMMVNGWQDELVDGNNHGN